MNCPTYNVAEKGSRPNGIHAPVDLHAAHTPPTGTGYIDSEYLFQNAGP